MTSSLPNGGVRELLENADRENEKKTSLEVHHSININLGFLLAVCAVVQRNINYVVTL